MEPRELKRVDILKHRQQHKTHRLNIKNTDIFINDNLYCTDSFFLTLIGQNDTLALCLCIVLRINLSKDDFTKLELAIEKAISNYSTDPYIISLYNELTKSNIDNEFMLRLNSLISHISIENESNKDQINSYYFKEMKDMNINNYKEELFKHIGYTKKMIEMDELDEKTAKRKLMAIDWFLGDIVINEEFVSC